MGDGEVPVFPLIARSVAVDFVNTEVIEDGQRRELLNDDRDLLRWARVAGLPVAHTIGATAEAGCLNADVRPLRASLRALFEARIDGKRPRSEDLARLNAVLASVQRGRTIEFRSGRFIAEDAVIATPRQVLQAVADEASQLLLSADVNDLQRCANERCILLFVDRSRRSSRRWCSMEVCGNRAKVRAHYQRARDR